MQTVVVMGSSGMLGSMVTDVLSRRSDLAVRAVLRSDREADRLRAIYPGVQFDLISFDAAGAVGLDKLIGGAQWIVNAIGITKPLIKDDNPEQIRNAIAINSVFPDHLAAAAEKAGARILQIATDCVYSGAKGMYDEGDPHDALDVYGKTKSLGETWLPSANHLRCSIIGPEPKDFKFLIEWFRRQPASALVNGFTNHQWNGVTTLQFARLCAGVIESGMQLPHLQHVVPAGTISKADMLRAFAAAYRREDINIRDTEAATVVDRTLATRNPELNHALWKAAGYDTPPTVPEMIAELAKHDYRAAPAAAAVPA